MNAAVYFMRTSVFRSFSIVPPYIVGSQPRPLDGGLVLKWRSQFMGMLGRGHGVQKHRPQPDNPFLSVGFRGAALLGAFFGACDDEGDFASGWMG